MGELELVSQRSRRNAGLRWCFYGENTAKINDSSSWEIKASAQKHLWKYLWQKKMKLFHSSQMRPSGFRSCQSTTNKSIIERYFRPQWGKMPALMTPGGPFEKRPQTMREPRNEKMPPRVFDFIDYLDFYCDLCASGHFVIFMIVKCKNSGKNDHNCKGCRVW